MIVKHIRLSEKAKDSLARVKGKTGIQNWNVLCRWALCLSLREPSMPLDADPSPDSNVEMSWQVFGGEYQELYEALIKQRCVTDGSGTDPVVLTRQLKLHLNRGIKYLSGLGTIASLEDLIQLPKKHDMGSK